MKRLITIVYDGDRPIGKIDKCKDCEWLYNDVCTYEGLKTYDGLKPCDIVEIKGERKNE